MNSAAIIAFLLEKDEDDPGNTLDTPDARLLRERDKYKAALERIAGHEWGSDVDMIELDAREALAEAVQS